MENVDYKELEEQIRNAPEGSVIVIQDDSHDRPENAGPALTLCTHHHPVIGLPRPGEHMDMYIVEG